MKVTTPRPPVLLLLGSKTTAHQIGIRARPSEPRSSRVWQAGPSRRDKKQNKNSFFSCPKAGRDLGVFALHAWESNQITTSQPAALPAGPQSAGESNRLRSFNRASTLSFFSRQPRGGATTRAVERARGRSVVLQRCRRRPARTGSLVQYSARPAAAEVHMLARPPAGRPATARTHARRREPGDGQAG